MAYITENDIKNFLYSQDVAELDRSDEGIANFIGTAISYAENYVRDRAGSMYDLDVEFQKSGDERKTTLIEIIAHLAIWKLCLVSPLVDAEGKKHYNYEWALDQLKLIERGSLLTDLPLYTDDAGDDVQPSAGVQFGYNEAIENNQY
jgi:hypothetical protein